MRILFAAAVALLLAFAGCMKVHEEMVILPDGSGKVMLSITVKAPKEDPDKSLEDDLWAEDPDRMERQVPGVVAFTRPKVERKDGLMRIQMGLYFEDVNKLKLEKDAGQGVAQEFSFRKEGEGFVLEVIGNVMADKNADRAENAVQQNEQMLSKLFEGFEFRHSIRLPGKLTKIEGFQTSHERTALYKIDEKDFQTPEGRKKVNKATHFRAACGRSDVSEAEAADFKKELDLARAEWAELRKELKKNAEKKKR